MITAMLLASLLTAASVAPLPAQQDQEVANEVVAAISGDVGSTSLLSRRSGVRVENVTIAEALSVLTRTSGVGVAFQPNAPAFARRVSCDCESLPVARVLDLILAGTGYGYTEVFDQVLVTPRRRIHVPEPRVQWAMASLAEPRSTALLEEYLPSVSLEEVVRQGTVTGRVVDALTNQPIVAAQVTLEGTQFGALTQAGGLFTIPDVPVGTYTVRAERIGYTPATAEVTVGEGLTVQVELRLSVAAVSLDEIVAIGYGTATRREVTGSVSSLGNRELTESVGRTRVDEAIVGRMPGVQVSFANGRPGSTPVIRIRGVGSISAGSQPLFVVDGVPVDNIETLNMNDVQSIDILKDASAAAIYGSRGANGVVLITTRRGDASGRPVITYDVFGGLQSVAQVREMLNARQQAQYFYDGIRNKNLDAGADVSGHPSTWRFPVPDDVLDVLEGRNTRDVNPLDYVLRTAPIQQHTLAIRGATDNVNYSVSAEYLDQDGIVIESRFRRMSLRANIDTRLSDRLSVRVNLNPSYIIENRVPDSGHASEPNDLSVIGIATTMHNWFPILESDGHPSGNAVYNTSEGYYLHGGYLSLANLANPVAVAREVKNELYRTRLLGNISADYSILSDLTLNVMLGGTLVNGRESYWRPNLPEVFYAFGTAEGREGSNHVQNWITEATLRYNRNFGAHAISAVGGYTAQKNTVRVANMSSFAFPNNLVRTLNAADEITSGSSSQNEWAMLSYLARVSYNYASKYNLSASIRTDGSSRFGIENRWGVFRSFGASWDIKAEDFMQDVDLVSDLRVRASYGETGNNNIGDYAHLATVAFTAYPSGSGYAPAGVPNPNLRWERQRQTNIGADIGILNDRIRLSGDWFHSISKDLLLNVQVPITTGFSSSLQNIGEVKNVGWELSLGTVNIQRPGLTWTTDFNISSYRNKVLKLGPEGAPLIGGMHITAVGRPIGMFYGWKVDPKRPIFLNQREIEEGPLFAPGTANQSRPGDFRFVDVNGDGIIDVDDRTEMGSPYPDFYYGFTSRLDVGRFNFSVTLNGVRGGQILSESWRSNFNTRGRMKHVIQAWNYWKSEDDVGDGKTPRPNDAPTGGNRQQWHSGYLQDASYLRVTNIYAGYQVPNEFANRLGFQSLRVYYSATNPFIFTDYNGFNPEVSNNGASNTAPGVDLNNYPIAKQHSLGVSVTF